MLLEERDERTMVQLWARLGPAEDQPEARSPLPRNFVRL